MGRNILKFGGTSVGNFEMMNRVTDIVKNIKETTGNEIIIVVSAMNGVTDQLKTIAKSVESEGNEQYIEEEIRNIKIRHYEVLLNIFDGNKEKTDVARNRDFESIFKDLEQKLKGVSNLKELSDRTFASIQYFGEIFSTLLLTNLMNQSGFFTNTFYSTNLVKTKGHDYLDDDVDFEQTSKFTRREFGPMDLENNITIVTGFAGSNEKGEVSLLGRGGSDYVATILANVLDADNVQIWKEVDGIMTADPKIVKDAILNKILSYKEGAQLSLAGAKVLHPLAISAVSKKKKSILIKNTFHPDNIGTEINELQTDTVKGININKSQVLLHFEDESMLGSYGYVNKITRVFLQRRIPIDSLASDEIGFTLSISKDDYDNKLLEELKLISNVIVIENVAKISIVGGNLDSDLKHKVSDSLKGKKVYSDIQSASLNNITFFVDEDFAENIVKDLHYRIFGI